MQGAFQARQFAITKAQKAKGFSMKSGAPEVNDPTELLFTLNPVEDPALNDLNVYETLSSCKPDHFPRVEPD